MQIIGLYINNQNEDELLKINNHYSREHKININEVSVLYKSICGGIKAYLIRNSLIGIRDSDASNIVVRYDYE